MAIETPALATATPAAESAEPILSLAEHKEKFWTDDSKKPASAEPIAETTKTPDAQKPRERHRAKSQQAGTDDVEAIAAHTKRLREAEDAIGIQKQPNESQRVYELRRRAEIAELARKHGQRAASPEPVKPAAVVTAPMPPQPSTNAATFTEVEPTQAQFLDQPDPYGAFQRALAAYDRRKDAFEADQKAATTRTTAEREQQQKAFDTWVTDRNAEHGQRLDTFLAANPEAKRAFEEEAARPEAEQVALTPILYAAIHLHEQGPSFMHKLLQNREFADELFLLTEGRPLGNPLTNPLVATVQRRLIARGQAVTTGSVASPRAHLAPRPPNPVRTAPQTPTGKPPSTEDTLSLRDHQKAFPAPTRR